MPLATTGSNSTGGRGLIAVDKVGNRLRFYDPQTLREMKALPQTEPCVHELAISADHHLAFVPLYGEGVYGNNKSPNKKIVVVDLARQEVADIIDLDALVAPHGMVATTTGKLWVVCDIPNKLVLVDPVRRAVEAAFDCPSKGSHIIALAPDESRVYVSAKEGPVAAFDTEAAKFVGSVSVAAEGVTSGNGSGTEGITPTPDGGRLLAIDNDRNDVRVIDTDTHREVDRVSLAGAPFSNPKRSRLCKIMFSPDAKHLVVTGYTGGNVWLIDAADYRRQSIVTVAKGPMGMTFTPDSGHVIVSSHDSGVLTRIDLDAKRAVSAHDGGAGIEVLALY